MSETLPQGVQARLIKQAVARLRGALPGGGKLARVGRNEFVAVVPRDPATTGVELEAAILVASLHAPLEASAWRVPAGASVGISLYPEHAQTPDSLINHAEIAASGPRRIDNSGPRLYDPKAQRLLAEKRRHIERLRLAIDRHEFTLHYQPQFDLTTLEPTGIEALVRWQHPDRGLLPPGTFIPAIDEGGLLPDLTRWVLVQAVGFNARLIADGIADLPIAVNVGADMLDAPGFVEHVAEVIHGHGIAADRLELEVLETTEVTDCARFADAVRDLRLLGVGVSIDDFGAGYSWLNRVRLANFSKLKIDRPFVAALPGEARDQAIVAAALDLADGLGMQVVAEGIETAEQVHVLRALGCRLGQGFWYACPMPDEEMLAWVQKPRSAGHPSVGRASRTRGGRI